MNRPLLNQLNRLLKGVPAQQLPVFLRYFLEEIFSLPPTLNKPEGYPVFKQKALPLITLYPPRQEGTPKALTPEIFALLNETNAPQRKHQGIFYTVYLFVKPQQGRGNFYCHMR